MDIQSNCTRFCTLQRLILLFGSVLSHPASLTRAEEHRKFWWFGWGCLCLYASKNRIGEWGGSWLTMLCWLGHVYFKQSWLKDQDCCSLHIVLLRMHCSRSRSQGSGSFAKAKYSQVPLFWWWRWWTENGIWKVEEAGNWQRSTMNIVHRYYSAASNILIQSSTVYTLHLLHSSILSGFSNLAWVNITLRSLQAAQGQKI